MKEDLAVSLQRSCSVSTQFATWPSSSRPRVWNLQSNQSPFIFVTLYESSQDMRGEKRSDVISGRDKTFFDRLWRKE